MPLPPPDPPASRPANPARVMLSSPLAAATRARVYYQRTRLRPRERGLRILAMVSSLLVHLLFLFGFVLGPAFQVVPPPESRQQFLQVRLVEPPEPPPPPPVRGTPPKERGPRHQGRRSRPAPGSERSANAVAVVAQPPAAAAAPPTIAKAAPPRAPKPQPAAAPPAPVSLPQPAPTPALRPIPLAAEPPAVSLPTPVVQLPVPPKFQPESVRKPQLEGNRPLPPPPSLALPELPPQAAPPITVSSIALSTELSKATAPASVTPIRAQLPAAPPVPELQPIPLPAQPAPSVNVQASLSVPAPTVPTERPQLQAPSIEVAQAELETVPLAPATPSRIEPPAPSAKIDVADAARQMDVQPFIARPQLSTPPTVAAAAPAAAAASPPLASPSPAPAGPPTPSPDDAHAGRDVSRAPDATPQGSELATPGQPEGVVAAPESTRTGTAAAQPAARQGRDNGRRGEQPGKGRPGGDQPGAEEGKPQGELGSYVQLKPRGDTEIMRHGVPNIGYQPTRFEQDWAPEGESSIDTALRRAVEKTKVSHTFHLPRGVRVECTVMPLLPIALFGCDNPDPPAKPVDDKVYERLHLAPANPAAAPAPAVSRTAPAPMVTFDNSAECAAARVAGSPPPPGCAGPVLPARPATPAASSSSWVPASDQFH
ncbi:hypothetical protein [Rhodanobacter denitrificans]|uniref:hypothetical protein n=1 Tax=Rhodanobacter denitrificans TaxID=666685 RepID=UPI001F48FF3D|nr:hypothetical protein [Rhodanobacter denitrificans]UJJ57446.1 hypothetical protein LRK55_12265 [Rhodanobacter denitrificans]